MCVFGGIFCLLGFFVWFGCLFVLVGMPIFSALPLKITLSGARSIVVLILVSLYSHHFLKIGNKWKEIFQSHTDVK